MSLELLFQKDQIDMLQVFHMNKGEDQASYAKNSKVQNKILSTTKPFLKEAILGFLGDAFPETIVVADLGCASGPNALTAVSDIIDVVDAKCGQLGRQRSPNFMMYLNDLPGNDFNEVFVSLASFHNKLKEEKGADFGPCFVAGVPGSFHGRLLPNKSLHFVHSSSSLHWLSQVPPGLDTEDSNATNNNPKMVNKGRIYLSSTSPSWVIKAYMMQFRKDFISFLKSRSDEVIHGGRMVLTFMGRRTIHPTSEEGCYPWELIAQSLMTMVSEGLIEEEKVDCFNVPYYAPCAEELKQLIKEEASFSIKRLEAIEVAWDGGESIGQDVHVDDEFANSLLTRGEKLAKMHRAVIESMFQHHFGIEIMDELFHRYARIVDDHLSKKDCKFVNVVVSLIRN